MINILWIVLALIGLVIVFIAQNRIKDNYYKIGLMRGYVKGYEDGLNRKHPLSHLELFEKSPISEVGKDV